MIASNEYTKITDQEHIVEIVNFIKHMKKRHELRCAETSLRNVIFEIIEIAEEHLKREIEEYEQCYKSKISHKFSL